MIAMRNILVPTDFSESAAAALTYAKALATEFNSRLHILHVVATPQVGWATETSTSSWPTLLADLEASARAQLEKQVPADDPLAGCVTRAAVIGVPVEQILEYVATNSIDFIVMGTHGRGLVGHMFLGSVAERVVRRSVVPVLTVHGAPPLLATRLSSPATDTAARPSVATGR
jgi:nucleotide-binding universal stress UspA family protein